MKLSTKAQNLDIISKLRLRKSKITNFYRYSVQEWITNRNKIFTSAAPEFNSNVDGVTNNITIVNQTQIILDSQ